ncbi:dynamin family protein [Candidatus Halobeggiatoa sp. HSG11]|nr:dynamin family protein [Candidatus Halobeggiatoa sp. HSG11]
MAQTQIEVRLKNLKEHLKKENNILCEVVDKFRELDKIAYKLGYLNPDKQSYAIRVSWWPMISVLGTYSAGKSTFINHYLDQPDLQRTGTHAVDDKFSVICFGSNENINILPAIAIDADPRFPFYQISQDLNDVADDAEQRLDSYLQLKACPSEKLQGKILIDSPGFDADNQRSSTLRITQHIVDLSDLVLVFFDARHPEPGAMRDTLEHLVSKTLDRPDSNKFLYILNQMDITAQEDNPEEVVAAWMRALAQTGLVTGRFYRTFNPDVCVELPENVKERLEKKSQSDLKEIHSRMEQIGIERSYRVIGMLEHITKDLEQNVVPQIKKLLRNWKKRVIWTEFSLDLIIVLLAVLWFSITDNTWSGTWQHLMSLGTAPLGAIAALIFIVGLWLHLKIGDMAAEKVLEQLQTEVVDEQTREGLTRAFNKNTGTWNTLFIWFVDQPVGWSRKTQQRLNEILGSVNSYVQKLNNRFTNPSGKEDT